MKKFAITLCLAAIFAVPVWSQSVDPCSQNTKLSGGTTFTSNTNGNASLSGSSYGYEMWTEGGNNNKLIWFGTNQGGGAAFRAEWNNPNDFLGRIGYYWGDGGKYTTYKNIYVDFNYTRSGRSTAGDYSYIGIYGWTKNPLVEYYVVEDWFGNQWQADTSPITTNTTSGTVQGTFTVDGSTYQVVKNTRTGPSINGNTTFSQYFSIRQTQRKCGTISVTEHFKKWESMGMSMGNMYEAKFLVEAGGGTGWFDASYIKLSQEDQPRGSTGGTSSNSTGGTSSSSKANSSSSATTGQQTCGEYQTSYCGGLAYSNVLSNSTTIPTTTSNCLYIGDFEVIQPALNSTVAINGVENTCGDDWPDCNYNTKPATKDGGYYVYVKTGTINSYQDNGWKGIVAKTKPTCTSSSSAAASSSSNSVVSSSSSAEELSSSSEEDSSPILKNRIPVTNFSLQTLSDKTLRIEANAPTVVDIYDLRGNKVTSLNVSASQTVKLALPNGVYFAKAHGTKSIRFVLR